MPRGDGKEMYGKPRTSIKRTPWLKPQAPSKSLKRRLADWNADTPAASDMRNDPGFHKPGSQR
jgi:hypothetical protein